MHFCCLLRLFLLVKAWNNYNFPSNKIPPSPRSFPALGCLKWKGALITFGGAMEQNYYNDVWLYHLDYYYWEVLAPSSDILPGNI